LSDRGLERPARRRVLTRAMCLLPHNVIVSVHDGLATLEGRLERRSDIPTAVQLTWRVDGVVGVVNPGPGCPSSATTPGSTEHHPPHARPRPFSPGPGSLNGEGNRTPRRGPDDLGPVC
jgi:hypothetical protein